MFSCSPAKKLVYYIDKIFQEQRETSAMRKLMVIDGNSIVNRAYYGVSQTLTTREGQPTNAEIGRAHV